MSLSLSLLAIDSLEVASFLADRGFGQVATHNPLDGPHDGWVATPPWSQASPGRPCSIVPSLSWVIKHRPQGSSFKIQA